MKALLAVLIFALVTSAAHSSENQATSNDVFSWTSGYIGMNVGRSGGTHARLIYSATGEPFVYDTGSFASGKIKTQHTYNKNWDDDHPGPTVAFSTSRNNADRAIGSGAEYSLTKNWSLKSEYLYTDLGKATKAQCNLMFSLEPVH